MDPVLCRVYPFLDFIGSLFTKGLQYRSINGIRSALSNTHDPIEGMLIRQHPLVKHLLKEVYNSRPLQPCYVATWEVSKVVEYMANMGDNTNVSLNFCQESYVC